MGIVRKLKFYFIIYHLRPKRNVYNMYTEKEDFITKDEEKIYIQYSILCTAAFVYKVKLTC